MRFSIIIPVYNAELYLSRCVDSIIKQNFKDYEIVLINDGSIDNSRKICDDYAKKHNNILVIHKENGGPISARKIGANKASGDYILCVDSDDTIDLGYLNNISNEIEQNGFPDLLTWNFKIINPNNDVSRVQQVAKPGIYCGEALIKVIKGFCYDDSRPNLNRGCLSYSLWTKAIKREIFNRAIDKVNEHLFYGEDMIASAYFLKDKLLKKIMVINYDGYNYYSNPNSSINSRFSFQRFERYEKTVLELTTVFYDEENKISIYSINALIGLLYSIFSVSNSWIEFKQIVKSCYRFKNIWYYASKAHIDKGFKDKIKILLIRRRLLFIVYLYFIRLKRSKNQ